LRQRQVTLPDANPPFAYFLGFLLGDGSLGGLSRPTIYLVGHLIDEREYYDRVVVPLISTLFGVDSYSYVRKGQLAYAVHFKSKRLIEFLSSTYGLPTHGSARFIPKPLLTSDSKIIKAFMAGLFDADGSLVFSKKNYSTHCYPSLEIKSVSKEMIFEVVVALKALGFRASLRKSAESWVAATNGVAQLELWMKSIGSQNIKHLSKYLLWKRQGSVRPKTTTPERLGLLHLDYDGLFRALRSEVGIAEWV
jgi:hypothetical protein